MMETLTVLALVVGILDAFLTFAVMHRQSDDEAAERRHWELQRRLDKTLEELLPAIVDRILEDERVLLATPRPQRPGQDRTDDGDQGDYQGHQIEAADRPEMARQPRWWIPDPEIDATAPKLP